MGCGFDDEGFAWVIGLFKPDLDVCFCWTRVLRILALARGLRSLSWGANLEEKRWASVVTIGGRTFLNVVCFIKVVVHSLKLVKSIFMVYFLAHLFLNWKNFYLMKLRYYNNINITHFATTVLRDRL